MRIAAALAPINLDLSPLVQRFRIWRARRRLFYWTNAATFQRQQAEAIEQALAATRHELLLASRELSALRSES